MSNILLTKEEQKTLQNVLESPLMKKVFAESLSVIYKGRAGAASLEQAAMAYNYTEGARGVLNQMLLLAEIKDELTATSTRRFRPTND